MEKAAKSGSDQDASPTDLEQNVTLPLQGVAEPQQKKHYSFYLSVLMLAMISLIVAWDVTALSLALPVKIPSPLLKKITALSA